MKHGKTIFGIAIGGCILTTATHHYVWLVLTFFTVCGVMGMSVFFGTVVEMIKAGELPWPKLSLGRRKRREQREQREARHRTYVGRHRASKRETRGREELRRHYEVTYAISS